MGSSSIANPWQQQQLHHQVPLAGSQHFTPAAPFVLQPPSQQDGELSASVPQKRSDAERMESFNPQEQQRQQQQGYDMQPSMQATSGQQGGMLGSYESGFGSVNHWSSNEEGHSSGLQLSRHQSERAARRQERRML